jgi:hypothetical protein
MKTVKSVLTITIVCSLFSFMVFLFGCFINDDSTFCKVVYIAGEGGTIDGIAEQEIRYGEDATTVIAVPNDGYKFVKWSDGITTQERQDKNITADKSVIAEFAKIKITVTYTASEGGTIDGISEQEIKYGEDATAVVAVPDAGYKFVKWSDGITTQERQDKNITADKSVAAEFAKIKITVTYTASEGGTIDGISEQEIKYGEDATTVIAVPNDGYKFVKWSDGKENADRKDINITSPISVVAEFEFLYGGGRGTVFSPYLIENYTHLQNMSYYPDAYYKLVNDLDLAGIDHEPIFDDINFFDGSFNGNNNTIKNLTVNTESNFPSLFGFIGNGSVSYFNLVNVSVKTVNFNTVEAKHNYCVGTIAGVSYGFIHDITVSGMIIADGLYYDGIAIGGLIGMAGGTIANCVTDIQIEISNAQRNNDTGITMPYVFGGFVGVGDSALIRECGASGTITLTESSPNESTTGGLIGYYFTSREVATSIKDCTTNVEICGDTYYDAGGFIGRVDVASNTSLQILNSAVYGDITMGNVGGFIGRGSSYGLLNIEKCHTESAINILSQGAGFIFRFSCSTSTNSIIKECYSKCDIVGGADSSKEGLYSGSAAGFCFNVSNLNLIKCFVECEIFASSGTGFIYTLGNCNVEQCYFSGIIYAENTNVGFCRGIFGSRIKNCYVAGKIISENSRIVRGFSQVCQSSEIINCYFAGELIYKEGITINIIANVRNSNIINFHAFFTATDGLEVIGQIINELGLPIDITVYEKIEEMYFIAEKLNDEEEEVWINVENSLPQLKYTI